MGAVNTTYTFTATDTITSTKMNDIIDQTTFTNDAVFDTTLAVASGKLKVNSQGITSNELSDNAVTTSKISDLAVITSKIADANVTTAKIADANVTTAKIADASVTAAKLNGAQTGTAPVYGVRAWVNFNGFAPLSIRASGNVSSVVRNAVGDYTITFTTAMPNANYMVSGTASGDSSHITLAVSTAYDSTPTTSTLRVVVARTGGAGSIGQTSDSNYISVSVLC